MYIKITYRMAFLFLLWFGFGRGLKKGMYTGHSTGNGGSASSASYPRLNWSPYLSTTLCVSSPSVLLWDLHMVWPCPSPSSLPTLGNGRTLGCPATSLRDMALLLLDALAVVPSTLGELLVYVAWDDPYEGEVKLEGGSCNISFWLFCGINPTVGLWTETMPWLDMGRVWSTTWLLSSTLSALILDFMSGLSWSASVTLVLCEPTFWLTLFVPLSSFFCCVPQSWIRSASLSGILQKRSNKLFEWDYIRMWGQYVLLSLYKTNLNYIRKLDLDSLNFRESLL